MPMKLQQGEELLNYPSLKKPANPADDIFDPFGPIAGNEASNFDPFGDKVSNFGSQKHHVDDIAAFSTPNTTIGDYETASSLLSSGQKEKDHWEQFE